MPFRLQTQKCEGRCKIHEAQTADASRAKRGHSATRGLQGGCHRKATLTKDAAYRPHVHRSGVISGAEEHLRGTVPQGDNLQAESNEVIELSSGKCTNLDAWDTMLEGLESEL